MTTLHEAAQRLLRQANGNTQDAARLLKIEIRENLDLLREAAEPYLDSAAWKAVRKAGGRASPGPACRPAPSTAKPQAAPQDARMHTVGGLIALARANGKQLLRDYTLPSGVPFGQASAEQLAIDADVSECEARFLRRVAVEMNQNGAARVSDIFTEAGVLQLLRKTIRENGLELLS